MSVLVLTTQYKYEDMLTGWNVFSQKQHKLIDEDPKEFIRWKLWNSYRTRFHWSHSKTFDAAELCFVFRSSGDFETHYEMHFIRCSLAIKEKTRVFCLFYSHYFLQTTVCHASHGFAGYSLDVPESLYERKCGSTCFLHMPQAVTFFTIVPQKKALTVVWPVRLSTFHFTILSNSRSHAYFYTAHSFKATFFFFFLESCHFHYKLENGQHSYYWWNRTCIEVRARFFDFNQRISKRWNEGIFAYERKFLTRKDFLTFLAGKQCIRRTLANLSEINTTNEIIDRKLWVPWLCKVMQQASGLQQKWERVLHSIGKKS